MFPDLVFMGSGYTYLQEFLPNVAQAVVREGWVDLVGLGRMVLAYPELPADVLAGRAMQRKRLCRTFSDCTTAPRNGMVSGCYPLDHALQEVAGDGAADPGEEGGEPVLSRQAAAGNPASTARVATRTARHAPMTGEVAQRDRFDQACRREELRHRIALIVAVLDEEPTTRYEMGRRAGHDRAQCIETVTPGVSAFTGSNRTSPSRKCGSPASM